MTETNTVPQFVSADTTIGEAVMRYPVAAEVMLSYGLACVGCHVSGIESIREGAMGHGQMDEDEIQELLKEINEAIALKEGVKDTDAPLIVTSKAATKIKEFAAEEENQEGIFLRVQVIPGGCSGFSYDLDFDHEVGDEDALIETETLDIRVDPDSMQFLKGSVLDYVDGLSGSGFKIENPNAQQNCGCGKSFS